MAIMWRGRIKVSTSFTLFTDSANMFQTPPPYYQLSKFSIDTLLGSMKAVAIKSAKVKPVDQKQLKAQEKKIRASCADRC